MITTRLILALLMLQSWLTTPTTTRDERGSVSTEQAIVTGAVVLLATVVVAAITAFAQGKLAVLGG